MGGAIELSGVSSRAMTFSCESSFSLTFRAWRRAHIVWFCDAGRTSGPLLLALQVDTSAGVFDVGLEDRRVMDQSVDGGQCHSGVEEDLVPFNERLICEREGIALIPVADELEHCRRLGLILSDARKIIEDKEIEAIQPVDG